MALTYQQQLDYLALRSSLDEIEAALGLVSIDQSNRRVFVAERLSDWSVASAGGTVTEALDSANGFYAGGNTITLTQSITSGSGPQNVLTTPVPFYVPQATPVYTTAEFSLALGQFMFFTGRDTATNDLWYIQVGLPDNRITLKAAGAADITVDPPGFTQSTIFRLESIVLPSGPASGKIRYYMFYKHNSTGAETHLFLGEQNYSSTSPYARVYIAQTWIATGAITVNRLKVYGLLGVMNGCSLDAGYVGWCPSPKNAIDFAANSYAFQANPAFLLADRFNGDRDFFINHAKGGASVQDMYDAFADFVLALKPKLIVLGSATNSLVTAIGSYTGPAVASYVASAKAQYLSMATQAIASGAYVLAQGVAPRHDAVPLANLAAFKAMSLEWNSWLASTLRPLGVRVCDVYSALEDPANPGRLAAWADAGDHVHFLRAAQFYVADAQFRALTT